MPSRPCRDCSCWWLRPAAHPRRARPRQRPASPARSPRAARSRATPPAGPRARRGREAGGQQPVQPDAGTGDRARSGPGLRPPGHRFLHRDHRRDHPVDGLQVGHRHRHRAGPGGDGVVVAPGRRRRLHHQPRHLRAGPPDRRRRPARTVPRVDRADAGPHAVLPRLHRHRRGLVGLQHGHRVRGLALVLRGQGDLAQHRGAGPAVRGGRRLGLHRALVLRPLVHRGRRTTTSPACRTTSPAGSGPRPTSPTAERPVRRRGAWAPRRRPWSPCPGQVPRATPAGGRPGSRRGSRCDRPARSSRACARW